MDEQLKKVNSIYSDIIISEEFKEFVKNRALVAKRFLTVYERAGFSREEAILFTVEDMKEMKVTI